MFSYFRGQNKQTGCLFKWRIFLIQYKKDPTYISFFFTQSMNFVRRCFLQNPYFSKFKNFPSLHSFGTMGLFESLDYSV